MLVRYEQGIDRLRRAAYLSQAMLDVPSAESGINQKFRSTRLD
jgi:hypothetical protein